MFHVGTIGDMAAHRRNEAMITSRHLLLNGAILIRKHIVGDKRIHVLCDSEKEINCSRTVAARLGMWVLAIIVLCNFLPKGQGLEFFVSISEGSDSWDGTSETNVDGTNVGPWKTLNHAVEEIRKIRPNPPMPTDSVTISVLPGKYFMQSGIDMDGRDSYMTIRALYDDETAISGGLVLNGEWTEEGGGIRTTIFQGSCGEAFVGAYRLLPARKPNSAHIGYNTNIAFPPYNTIKDLFVETDTCTRDSTEFRQSCPDEDRLGFVFENELDSQWAHLDQTRILIFHSWIAEFAIVSNITDENGVSKVYFKEPLSSEPIGNWVKSGDWRYIIYNNKAVLDIPGEYVCISNGDDSSTISYIPPDEPGLEELPVVVTQLPIIMQMREITDIYLEGIKFEHSSSNGMDGYNWGTETALKVISSKNVVVTDCKFSSMGMVGMYVRDSHNIQVTKSVFTDIGYHGFLAQYVESDPEGGMFDVSVDNNMFDGCGLNNFWQPACIWLGGDNNMTIRNNEFTNVPYTPINIHGLMNHGPDYWEDNGVIEPTRDDYVFHIEFNHFYEYGLGIMNDFGAVYTGKDSIFLYFACKENSRIFSFKTPVMA